MCQLTAQEMPQGNCTLAHAITLLLYHAIALSFLIRFALLLLLRKIL